MTVREYAPDIWIIVKITPGKNPPFFRILVGWYGGYLYTDRWRINSGITGIEDRGDTLVFTSHSGNRYRCHKEAYGCSNLTSAVYIQMQEAAPRAGHELELLGTREALALKWTPPDMPVVRRAVN